MTTPPRPDAVCVQASSYDAADLARSLARALTPLGGMRAFVSRGDRVLLKPNLLSAARPARAVTTHPALVAAVARLVLEAGGRPVIGDSPGGALAGLARVHERTGMRAVAGELGVPLVSFEGSGAVRRRVDGGWYPIARAACEADVVISLPKLKTHALTLFTGAVKNCFGVVPGFAKGNLHLRYPRPADFVEVLLDVAAVAAPRLTIVDAVDCMEGNGPASGRPVHVGRLVAGSDVVAVERASAEVLGLEPDDAPILAAAARRGLARAPAIVWEDGPPRADPVRLPPYWAARLIPRAAGPVLRRLLWVRAAVDETWCTRCGACVDACPVEAVRAPAAPGGAPRVDGAACIGCLVCREACADGAISMRLSPLARRVV